MSEPVLLVAVDGLDWKRLRAGVAAGHLPEMARLLREGAHAEVAVRACVPGLTAVEEPLNSPTLWTTVATGQYYFKHGVYDFCNLLDSAENPPLFESRHVLTPRLWDVLSHYGRDSIVVGYYVTYPAYPIRGVMVSDLFGEVAARKGVWPPSLADGLSRVLGAESYESYATALRSTLPEDLIRVEHGPVRRVDRHQSAVADWHRILERFTCLSADERAALLSSPAEAARQKQVEYRLIYPVLRDERFHRIFLHLLGSQPWGLAIVYYRLVDFVSHGFWVETPGPPGDFVRAFGTVVEEAYRWIDERLGELRQSVPPGTRLLVLSDHGFERDGRVSPSQEWRDGPEVSLGRHADPAVLIAHGGPARGALRGVSLLDIAPTVYEYFDVPQARSLDGGPVPGLLRVGEPAGGRTVSGYPYTRPTEAGEMEEPEQRAVLERLAALGYM